MRILDFLFPPKCICCGAVLESVPELIHKKGGDAFCTSCRAEWEKAKLSQCARCRLSMIDCRCSSPMMRRNGNNVLLKLCSYGGEPIGAVKKLIFALKRNADRRAERFAAYQLHLPIMKYVSTYLGADLIITNVPRRERGVINFGYDQGKVLAKNISKITHIQYLPLLVRERDGSEQKNLGGEARRRNVKNAFSLAKCAEDLKGKCVILVDDVVTTGASINECISVLKVAEPAAILPVCIAHATRIFEEESENLIYDEKSASTEKSSASRKKTD